MKQRPRIYYTESQKKLMWDHWQKGDSLQQTAQLFERNHSSIQRFSNRSSEERIRVTRVHKRQGENGSNFWLFAEWIDWRPGGERYFAEAVFNQMVADQAIDLIAPLKQPLHEPTGFVGALLMYSMKTEFIVSLFAEYEDEYIHFYWDTTA
ncbi:hypothetical protein [Pseudomonas izuensis]|uniref:hypothetical protein n=1 Tax=Pseudomonas izuensis TaxID=2684212 RepID=UPI003CCDA12E